MILSFFIMNNNPQKLLENRYHVVPRTIILIIVDGKVLLQKAPVDKKIFPGLFNGMGGHIERGEDVLSAAKRELLEEAGILCDDLQLTGTIFIDVKPEQGILLFVFSGEKYNGEPLDSEEGSLHWISLEELETINVVEDLPELVNRIMSFKKSGRMFFGKYIYDDEGKKTAIFNVD